MEKNTTPEMAELPHIYGPSYFYIGMGLAISSSIFIGSSFIVKKIALGRLSAMGYTRAGSGGFGYLRQWIWWAGLLSMAFGEGLNFAAYMFAPASLVTPLGALSVLVSALLASKYLNENLNLLGKLGCLLCITGSVSIVIHSPKEEEIETVDVLLTKLQDPLFICYVFIVVTASAYAAIYLGPRYGHRNVTVYTGICSGVGSLTVMATKGLGLALKETFTGYKFVLDNWLPYFFLLCVICCAMVQMNYLNKALDLFNTNIVTPVYYVFFTTLVITASAILFREWENLSAKDVVGNVCGFVVVILGIFLLNGFKDLDISLHNVSHMFRSRHELLPSGPSSSWSYDDEKLIKDEVGQKYGSGSDRIRNV